MDTTPPADAGATLDLREIFLARASARLLLYEAGAMTLDEAISGLAPAFWHITGIPDCACDREMRERWDRVERRALQARKQKPSKKHSNWRSKR